MLLVVYSSIYSPLDLFLSDAFNTIASTDARIEPRTFAEFALTVRAANHPATAHSYWATSHPL
jgi:hypothetical protein